jgi:uncharacterized protein (DUF779 family)
MSPQRDEPRVVAMIAATAAEDAVHELVRKHGPLIFVESHGCCDSSAPMCLPAEEFPLGASDLHVTDVCGCPYYVDARLLSFRQNVSDDEPLVLDLEPGYPEGISLAPTGHHFVVRSHQ